MSPQRARVVVELGVLGLVAFLHLWLATHGTFDPFGSEALSVAYDFLGDSLLRLDATVPTNHESLRVDGRDYIYFAPFPALLRIPLNALWPAHFGEWGRILTWAAGVLALVAWMRLLRVVAPDASPAMRTGLGLAFGLGTPVVYLASSPYIWHEGIAIALAASLGALVPLARAVQDGDVSPRSLAAYSTCTAVAYLTRLTFGVPHLMIVAWLLANAALVRHASRLPGLAALLRADLAAAVARPRALAALLGPLLAAVAFFSWYNVERFGNPFVYTSHASQLIYRMQPELLERHERIGTFNLRRVPSGLRHYLGDAGSLGGGAPFVHLQLNDDLPDRLYLDRYREWSISLWLVSGWLLALAGIGVAALVAQRRRVEALLALPFAGQLAVVLSYYWVSHRFSAELLPGLCWLAACALHRSSVLRPRLAAALRAGFTAAVVVGVALTLASTLSWNARFNWGAPDAWRQRLLEAFGARPHASAPLGQPVAPTPPRRR